MKITHIMVSWVVVGIGTSLVQAAEIPTVSRRESRLLEQVTAVAQTNATAAMRLLEPERALDEASAALDFVAGNLYSRLAQDSAAAAAYRVALDKAPGFTAAQAGLARALAAQAQWPAAEALLRPLAEPDDAEPDVLLLYGFVLIEQGRAIPAEWVYRRVLRRDDTHRDALYGLARCALGQGRSREGIAVLEMLLQDQPNDANAWALLADLWLERDQPAEALVRLESARRLGAASGPMLAQLGDLYVHQQLHAPATEAYLAALESDSSSPVLVLRAVEGLLFAGDAQRAGEWLEHYREIEPSPGGRYFRAQLRWAELAGQPEAARTACRAWIAVDPLNLDALLAMGEGYRAEGALDAAALWFERARDAHPRVAEPLLRLAGLAMSRRDYKMALERLEHAYGVDGNPETARAIAHIRRMGENR